MNNQDITKQINEIHTQVRSLLNAKLTEEEVVAKMKANGHEPHYIETVIENIRDEADDKKNFRNSMIMGLCYLVGGAGINIMSYKISDNLSGTYFYLFWGIVVLGIITIARGFILYRR